MLIITHPRGTEYVRALLAGCEEAELDFRFHTTLAFTQSDWRCRFTPTSLRREFLQRVFPVSLTRICRHSKLEMTRLLADWLQLSTVTAPGSGKASPQAVLDEFEEYLAGELRKNRDYRLKVRAVHAYEDHALKLFQTAREVRMKCSYELALPYWQTSRQLLREEAERCPDWAETMKETQLSPAQQERKTQEVALADLVFCPSQFVLRSLPAEAQKKAVVAEFGSPEFSQLPPRAAADTARPLRLLFAGLLTQRKGLADLFAALKLLNRSDVELVVSGPLAASMDFYRHQCANFRYEPPKSHRDLLLLMQQCDVLVLPSIVEGRALVQQEAMSCGLPLIVTANAGGEDLVEPEKTGLLVPIRSPEKLAEAINWFAGHRADLPLMSEQAQRKVAECTWKHYARKVLAVLAKV